MPNHNRALVWDIEADNLYWDVTKIWCIAAQDYETHEKFFFGPDEIEEGVEFLSGAGKLMGHNIIQYDIPVVEKLYGVNLSDHVDNIIDSLIISRLYYGDMWDRDSKYNRNNLVKDDGSPDKKLWGSHSLKSWGLRLGEHKLDFTDFSEYTEEMKTYCIQDVETNTKLFDRLKEENDLTIPAFKYEHMVTQILWRQEKYGFFFDIDEAKRFEDVLRFELKDVEDSLVSAFGKWVEPGEVKTPKRSINYSDPMRASRVEGAPFTEIEIKTFNPGSRKMIGERLVEKYNWQPKEFTEKSGQPKIDEDILSQLPYPEAELLVRYLTIKKRLGQLADGQKAWLKLVRDDQRIHGYVNGCGALTGRMSHSNPNLAQVPSSDNPYGTECRTLFTVPKDKVLVGIDASGLEDRVLGGYLATYDDGEYIERAIYGKKEDGSDLHSVRAKLVGVDRNTAKPMWYGLIYGAGDYKLGQVVGSKGDYQQVSGKGREVRAKITKGLKGFEDLLNYCHNYYNTHGYIPGLDGRHIYPSGEHTVLNNLCQGAGAVIMKVALLILDKTLQEDYGLTYGTDYEFVANVHDEWQIEAEPNHAEDIARVGIESIRQAGVELNFGCPLDGDAQIGKTWADTH